MCVCTVLQRAICQLRYNKVPYRIIQELYDLPGPATVARVLRLTAAGFRWNKGEMKGGHYPKLPDCCLEYLKREVEKRTLGLNHMKTSEAKQVIYDLVDDYNKRTFKRLRDWNSPELASNLEEKVDEW